MSDPCVSDHHSRCSRIRVLEAELATEKEAHWSAVHDAKEENARAEKAEAEVKRFQSFLIPDAYIKALKARAEHVEAELAVAQKGNDRWAAKALGLKAELAKLERWGNGGFDSAVHWKARTEKAEAEVERLRAALELAYGRKIEWGGGRDSGTEAGRGPPTTTGGTPPSGRREPKPDHPAAANPAALFFHAVSWCPGHSKTDDRCHPPWDEPPPRKGEECGG